MRSIVTQSISRLKTALSQDFLSLLNDAVFMFLCRVSGAVLVLVTQVLLARWMGTSQLGTYVLAFSWCIFLSVIAGLGFPRAAARFIGNGLARDRDDLVHGYIRQQKQIGLIVSLAVVLIGGLILVTIGRLKFGVGQNVLLFALLAVPVFTMINVYGSIALAMSWFRTAALPNSLMRPALFLTVICIVWYSRQSLSADTVMLFHVVVALTVVVGQAVIVNRRLRVRYYAVQPSYESKLWMRTAPSLLVGTLFVNYFQELDTITVGMYLEADQLAIYNVSLRLSFLVVFGIQAVNAIAMPRTAQFHAKADHEALQNHITDVARLQFLWSLFAVVAVTLAGKYVLALFGPSFVEGYPALVILVVAQLVSAIFGPVIPLLSMTGHQDNCLYVFACALATMLVLNHVLIDAFGLNGAAIAVALTFLLQSAWLYAMAIRRLGIYPSALRLGKGRD